jgi:antigen flippase
MLGLAARARAAGSWLLHSRHSAASIALTVLARFVLVAINLVTGIITARALNVTGRGEQVAMGLWPTLIPYLLSLGIATAVRYCIRKEPDRRSEFFTVAMIAATILSCVSIGGGLVFIPLWLHSYTAVVIQEAQLLMAFAPQVTLNLILTAMLEAQGDFKTANAMRVISTVCTLVLLAILAASGVLTPFRSALSYLVPPVLTGVWTAWRLRSFFLRKSFDPRPGLRVLGSYGLRSYGVDVLQTLSAQVDQVLVVGILNASSMGIYTVALSTSRVLQNLHAAVVTVVFPNASGLVQSRVVPMVARAARISTAIAALFAIALAGLLPILIPLFYGEMYRGAIHVAQILTLEALVGGLDYVLAQTFMASNRPGLVTAFQGIGFLIAVPAMLLLMPRFGLIGAAAALLISTTTRLSFLLASYRCVLHVPMPNLIPTADDLLSFRRALQARS